MSRPAWGTAPIKCGNRKCDWTGTERDLIHHPDDAGKFSVRNVCPKCHADSYTFTRRKRVASCQLVTETLPPNAEVTGVPASSARPVGCVVVRQKVSENE